MAWVGTRRRHGRAAGLADLISALLPERSATLTVREVPEFLSSALMAAHHQIIRYAAEKGMLDTPRTTLVAAVMQRNNVRHWVHCGDSRLYFVRNGELLTRTRDHSYMEQQAHLGRSTGSAHQPQHAVHLPGLTGQAGVRSHRDRCTCSRATASLLCSDGCGARL